MQLQNIISPFFVDGEFWHGKDFEKHKLKIKNNKDYWIEKIQENIERDISNDNQLKEQGSIPFIFGVRKF